MGWNNWYSYKCGYTASDIRAAADTMVQKVTVSWSTSPVSMVDLGYTYVNIDDCWQYSQRGSYTTAGQFVADPNGPLVPDPVKFPSQTPGTGIKDLADSIHSLDPRLKIGIYTDAGTMTCAGFPGSYQHEQTDANTFASWGIDFLKEDVCNIPSSLQTEAGVSGLYTTMKNALVAAGRPMAFSICTQGKYSPWKWGPTAGNMWRTTGDIKNNWLGFLSVLDSNAAHGSDPGVGPYAFNDPDILQVGLGGMTEREDRSQFSLWAMMAAPLLAGNRLATMSSYARDTLLNKAVIDVNQDPKATPGRVVKQDPSGNQQVWSKDLTAQSTSEPKVCAVALFNRNYNTKTMTVNWSDVGLQPGSVSAVRDLWALPPNQAVSYMRDAFTVAVPAHATVVLRVVGTTKFASGNLARCTPS